MSTPFPVLESIVDGNWDPVEETPALRALAHEYVLLYTHAHGRMPVGPQPIPSDVAQADVVIYLVFKDRVSA